MFLTLASHQPNRSRLSLGEDPKLLSRGSFSSFSPTEITVAPSGGEVLLGAYSLFTKMAAEGEVSIFGWKNNGRKTWKLDQVQQI